MPIHQTGIEPTRYRCFNEIGAGIDACDFRACVCNALRQRTVAAAKIEDALACLRRQPVIYASAQIGHEARIALVSAGGPGL